METFLRPLGLPLFCLLMQSRGAWLAQWVQVEKWTLAIRTTVMPIRILIRTTVVPIRILIRRTVVADKDSNLHDRHNQYIMLSL